MRPLKDIVREVVKALRGQTVPTRANPAPNSRQEPPALAPQVDVDQIMAILRAAEMGSTRDLFTLYRDVVMSDSHLQAELAKRKLAVLGDALTFTGDPANVALVQAQVENVSGWLDACAYLLDAVLWPVSVVEKVYRATPTGFDLSELRGVPYHLLDYTTGRMRIFDVDPVSGNALSTTHEVDPGRYIVHRGHLLTVPDNWGGPMRSILFWWLLSSMNREWWGRFIERYGSPFLLGKYADGDEESRGVLERAFALATRLGGLAVTESTSVEIKQAAASYSGQAYERFLAICQREKSKLIVGQTLSSDAQATGMNSGNAAIQENVRKDIRDFDDRKLSETLRDHLYRQICEANGRTAPAPKSSFKPAVPPAPAAMPRVPGFPGLLNPDAGGEDARAALTALSAAIRVRGPAMEALNAIDRAASADLAQALRRRHTAAARIIRESHSADEALQRLTAYFPEMSGDQVSTLVADAMTAAAANGAMPRENTAT